MSEPAAGFSDWVVRDRHALHEKHSLLAYRFMQPSRVRYRLSKYGAWLDGHR